MFLALPVVRWLRDMDWTIMPATFVGTALPTAIGVGAAWVLIGRSAELSRRGELKAEGEHQRQMEDAAAAHDKALRAKWAEVHEAALDSMTADAMNNPGHDITVGLAAAGDLEVLRDYDGLPTEIASAAWFLATSDRQTIVSRVRAVAGPMVALGADGPELVADALTAAVAFLESAKWLGPATPGTILEIDWDQHATAEALVITRHLCSGLFKLAEQRRAGVNGEKWHTWFGDIRLSADLLLSFCASNMPKGVDGSRPAAAPAQEPKP